jgi:glyoxylase-like metal-dependent hydrolase (beta-lactamase superfamily II)
MTINATLAAGAIVELAPGVRRLVAPNPGLMTGPGTNTYLLGIRDVAVIDPGPATDSHIEAVVDAAGLALRWVLVTHTHPDHSPAAALLARCTGAALLGRAAPAGQHQDATFHPDRVLADGEVLSTGEFELDVIHTPGHASNHLCFLHSQLKWLFTGDHIINGSTVVIDPPDGNMTDYLQSLERLKSLDIAAIAPGHGDIIRAPREAIDWIISHRLEREGKVAAAVAANANLGTRELVALVYEDVDSSLYDVAERSLLAHLEKLEHEGRVACREGHWRMRNG